MASYDVTLASLVDNGQRTLALVDGDRFVPVLAAADIASKTGLGTALSAAGEGTVDGLLREWDTALPALQALQQALKNEPARFDAVAKPMQGAKLGAPVTRPGKMLFAGANYPKHRKESQDWRKANDNRVEVDTTKGEPYMFLKLAETIIGPHEPVVFPDHFEQLDHEVELGAVIGKPGRNIGVDDAMAHVAGYVLINDMSMRDITSRDDWPFLKSDWFAGKNFDRSAPIGPYFVAAASVPDYRDLKMQLWVNGELMQDEYAGEMTYSLERQIAFASKIATLNAGDVFATGTPSGVGFGTGRWLKPGDVIEAEIEGFGRQHTEVLPKGTVLD